MPLFRGIDVTILAQSELARLPEYPHPDGSSVHLRARDDTAGDELPQTVHDVDPTHSIKVNPTVSVYIPSVPGAQFWINYSIERKPDPSGHLFFFKLYMNGRHITSWGINPRIKSNGQVERALYEPSERWDYEDDGTVMKQNGIEARYFHFIGGQPEMSVAEDGGLIEVRVFRAKGRKRRAARLDQYRHQEEYGIAAPSGGLLDHPQDVTFFDFHLIDPKDTPFASFRFHYRSWENLRQLNLIPRNESSIFESCSTNTIIPGIDHPTSTDDIPQSQNPPDSPVIRPDPDESVFKDSDFNDEWHDSIECDEKPRRNSVFVLRTPPQLRPRSASSHNMPQPSKTLRDGAPLGVPDSYLQRPLPDRPLPEIPTCEADDSGLGRSRKASSASAVPSVTPSLLSYVKDDSYLDESVEFGQAQKVDIRKKCPGGSPEEDKESSKSTFTPNSGYTKSPLVRRDLEKGRSMLLNPGDSTPSPETRLEDHSVESQRKGELSLKGIGKGDSPESSVASRKYKEMGIDFSKFPHLQLSESDWMRRTPSPATVPRGFLSPKRLWNTLRWNKPRSPLRDLPDEMTTRNQSVPNLDGHRRDEKHGRWI